MKATKKRVRRTEQESLSSSFFSVFHWDRPMSPPETLQVDKSLFQWKFHVLEVKRIAFPCYHGLGEAHCKARKESCLLLKWGLKLAPWHCRFPICPMPGFCWAEIGIWGGERWHSVLGTVPYNCGLWPLGSVSRGSCPSTVLVHRALQAVATKWVT
jgi:hypothetical protein